MQPNTITLSVDLANSATATDQVFSRHEEQINRSTYIGPLHSLVARHVIQLYRTFAKRAGVFLGSTKTSVKYTKDVTVLQFDGSETKAPLIVEINFSVPVGAANADVLAARQHAVAMLDRDDIMTPLNTLGSI